MDTLLDACCEDSEHDISFEVLGGIVSGFLLGGGGGDDDYNV